MNALVKAVPQVVDGAWLLARHGKAVSVPGEVPIVLVVPETNTTTSEHSTAPTNTPSWLWDTPSWLWETLCSAVCCSTHPGMVMLGTRSQPHPWATSVLAHAASIKNETGNVLRCVRDRSLHLVQELVPHTLHAGCVGDVANMDHQVELIGSHFASKRVDGLTGERSDASQNSGSAKSVLQRAAQRYKGKGYVQGCHSQSCCTRNQGHRTWPPRLDTQPHRGRW